MNHGDEGVKISAFPRIPITFILWRGDDEFSPKANVIFDATIASYLSTEDILVLIQLMLIELKYGRGISK